MSKIKYDDQCMQTNKKLHCSLPHPHPLKNWVHLCSLFKLLEKPFIFVPFISTLRGGGTNFVQFFFFNFGGKNFWTYHCF